MRHSRARWIAFATFVAVAVAARLALPTVLEEFVNRRLASLEHYEGEVQKIHVALWRGAYRIEGIRIVKTGAGQPTPFFSGDEIEFSVEWSSFALGSIVSEAIFVRPRLNLVTDTNQKRTQLGTEENWTEEIEDLFPFRFNTVEVRDGTLTFRAPGIRADEALDLEHVNGEVTNLTNAAKSEDDAFAKFELRATALGDAPVKLDGRVDPWSRPRAFDLNFVVEGVNLPEVNPWLREYLNADAERGEFALYLELAAADGRFAGYAKPVLNDVMLASLTEREPNPLRRLWEGVVQLAATVFENQGSEQVAARIPFSGTIEGPDAGVVRTIASVLRNAFIGSFHRSLEDSISLRDVRKRLREHEVAP